MGGLEQITEDELTAMAPQAPYGTMPPGLTSMSMTMPFAPNPMAGKAMDLSEDLYADYQRTRDVAKDNRANMRAASDELANSYMKGYDENAYGAQAWSQAGIGAAHPTLSALESLNRAVAGYSGVKLQQRADLGKRIEQEKAERLRQQQVEQQLDSATKNDASQKLLDLYKTGQISRMQLASALTQRYVNVPGRGLVDKWALAQGSGDGVVVPGFKPIELLQQMQKDTAAQLEQDKNLHFEDADAYQNAYNKILQGKISEADKLSGGLFSNAISSSKIDPFTPQNPAPAQELETLKSEPYSVKVAPGTPDAEKAAIMQAAEADFAKNGATMPAGPEVAPEPITATAPVAAPGSIMPKSEPMPAPFKPAAPWGEYATRPLPAAKAKPAVTMFSKVQQERDIEREKQAERWAEEGYKNIAQQSTSTAAWYDTLRAMESTDLKATGSFANVRNFSGKLLESMGYPNAEAAKSATTLSGLNNLIMQGIQQRLSVQNGVQARDDAERERQSFAQITDPQNVFKHLVKQAQAKALRQMEQEEFYRAWKTDKGTYVGADGAWNDYIKDTPIFATYGGQPVYMNQWVDSWLRTNKEALDDKGYDAAARAKMAADAWRAIAKRKK
jgi:hypothetical protein